MPVNALILDNDSFYILTIKTQLMFLSLPLKQFYCVYVYITNTLRLIALRGWQTLCVLKKRPWELRLTWINYKGDNIKSQKVAIFKFLHYYDVLTD